MPLAAVADRENLSGALAARIEGNVDSDDEHPSSPLRHSEVTSVENSVSPQVPEVRHRTLEGVEVPTCMAGEESRNVLEEDDGWSVSPHKLKEGEGESGSLPGEPASLAGDAEVLAGKTAGPEGGVAPITTSGSLPSPRCPSEPCKVGDRSEVRDARPSLREDGAGVGVDLGEADGSPSGSLKSHIESAHSGEERCMGQLHRVIAMARFSAQRQATHRRMARDVGRRW
jgi:hypothetical protein